MNTTHSTPGSAVFTLLSKLLRVGLTGLVLISSAQATTLSWSGASNGLWSTTTNWAPNGTPGAGDTADFGSRTLTGAMTVDLAGGATIGVINLGDLGSAKTYALKSTTAGGSILTLDNGTSNAQINENATTAGDSMASTLNLSIAGNGNLDIANNSAKSFVVSGTITGTATTGNTNTLTVKNTSTGTTSIAGIYDGANGGKINVVLDAGAGSILLTGNSGTSFAGAVEIKSGLNKMSFSGSLGNATSTGAAVTIDAGGTLDINGKTGVQRNLVLSGTGYDGKGALINSNAAAASMNSGNLVTLAANAGVGAVSGSSLTLSGTITGAGALMVVDAGIVGVTHANSYTGGTQVQKGTLIVSGIGSTLGTGNISVSTGATLSLLSLNAVADAANISFAIDSIINLGYTGTETIGALDFNGNFIGTGSYTATQLNNFFGLTNNVFTGSGLLNVTAVPEPSTICLLGLGVMALACRRARRQ